MITAARETETEAMKIVRELLTTPGLIEKKIEESDPQGEKKYSIRDMLVSALNGYNVGMEYAADIMDGKA